MAKKKKEAEEEPECGYIDPDILYRYIGLMYDFNAESKKKYPDYYDRKREMAIQAGFGFGEAFDEDVERMLLGKNDEVNQQIVDYVISFGSPDLVSYVAYQEMFIKQSKQSMSETDEKKIKTVYENMDNLSQKIKRLEIEIFGGEDRSLREALYSSKITKLRLRPEYVAKMINDKKLDLPDVYYGK
jgi:hypothetical protein